MEHKNKREHLPINKKSKEGWVPLLENCRYFFIFIFLKILFDNNLIVPKT